MYPKINLQPIRMCLPHTQIRRMTMDMYPSAGHSIALHSVFMTVDYLLDCINLLNEPLEKNFSYATFEQQSRRSACGDAQSDKHLCCSQPR